MIARPELKDVKDRIEDGTTREADAYKLLLDIAISLRDIANDLSTINRLGIEVIGK